MEGFGDLAIVIIAMMVFTLILGNIISSLIFIYKKSRTFLFLIKTKRTIDLNKINGSLPILVD